MSEKAISEEQLKEWELDAIRSATGDNWPQGRQGWVPVLMLAGACGEIHRLRAENAEMRRWIEDIGYYSSVERAESAGQELLARMCNRDAVDET